MKMKNSKIRLVTYLQIFITFLIIMSTTFIIKYENETLFNTVISVANDGSIMVLHNKDVIKDFKEKGRPIITFNHNSCQFISIFNENNEHVTSLILGDTDKIDNDISSLIDWKTIFDSKENGYIDLSEYNIDMKIIFNRVSTIDGTKYLVVYNINNEQDQIFTTFTFTCYFIVVLSFIMLITVITRRFNDTAKIYMDQNNEIYKILSK